MTLKWIRIGNNDYRLMLYIGTHNNKFVGLDTSKVPDLEIKSIKEYKHLDKLNVQETYKLFQKIAPIAAKTAWRTIPLDKVHVIEEYK